MVRLLHCADVHLKAEEREYGLGVLREIVDQARHAEAQFLLICGDLFDGFDDAAALRREVAEIFSAYEGEVIYLPGNHEEIGKRGDLRQFDLGRLTLADELPFAIFKRNVGGERLEVLAIPYQTGSVRWRDWQIPPPANGAIRVAMAHATVPTMVYTGGAAESEEADSLLGEEFFARQQVRYGALGHIHRSSQKKSGSDTLLAYAGSATVWRKGEGGPRGVLLVEIGDQVGVQTSVLARAGQYRHIPIPLSLSGDPADLDIAALTAECGENDLLEFEFFGIAESDGVIQRLEKDLQTYGASRRRQPIITCDTGNQVHILPGLARHPLAEAFLKKWNEGPPAGVKAEVWQRAREIALLTLAEMLQGRPKAQP